MSVPVLLFHEEFVDVVDLSALAADWVKDQPESTVFQSGAAAGGAEIGIDWYGSLTKAGVVLGGVCCATATGAGPRCAAQGEVD
ncbi:MAG: hypothetical protein KF757_07445 [Phycisphaeraceae bacterium]|nr:hypothetical protein [Phycisphaeraceae bacterium]MCW5764319.1 hypothetical protein [Phycisphaeraceae bacterium]